MLQLIGNKAYMNSFWEYGYFAAIYSIYEKKNIVYCDCKK